MIEVEIPKTIKVGGYDYTIQVTPDVDIDLESRGHFGEHSTARRCLRIRSQCLPQEISDTFLHETIHAVDSVYSYAKLSDEQVEALSHGLLQVLEQLGIRFILKIEKPPAL